MRARERLMAGLAGQLGHPDGLRGRLVAGGLNRGNRGAIIAAVEQATVGDGQRAADLGFGGGLGLRLLLDRVGPSGHVDGVDVSETMVEAAARAYGDARAQGRLTLHTASVTALPLQDACLDAAITVNTIYFVDDLPTGFGEIARCLRPGGRLVVGLGDPDAMEGMPFTRYGFELRPVDEVIGHLRSAGFSGLRHERVVGAPRAFHLLVGTID